MADEPLPELAHQPHVTLRQGGDRRHGERRRHPRTTPERRRRERRRAQIRGLILTLVTMLAPLQLKKAATAQPGQVLVSASDFRLVPPERAYDAFIAEAAEAYAIDAALIKAVIRAESQFNPFAISSAGALGLMQLMPSLAAELGVKDPFDPRENIMAGASYLKRLLNLHRGNIELTLASYNAGPGAVARYRGRIPPFKETRAYVRKITGFLGGRQKK